MIPSRSQEADPNNAGADQPAVPIPLDLTTRSTSGSGSFGAAEAEGTSAIPGAPPLRRRSTLQKKPASISSYRTTPITKHYSLNNQILQAFEHHYENKSYTLAYAIGLQFVETALLEIPKHGYFFSNRHCDDRMSNTLNAIRVSNMLKSILDEQQKQPTDDFGLHNLEVEYMKVQKLTRLAVAQSEASGPEDYEDLRSRLETELNQMDKQEGVTTTTLMDDGMDGLVESVTTARIPTTSLVATASRGSQQPKQPNRSLFDDGSFDNVPRPPEHQRSISNVMREIMKHGPQSSATEGSGDRKPDPPSLRNNVPPPLPSPPPPPPLLMDSGSGLGWSVNPGASYEQPDFGRQMSSRTYADHVALERALYLSGLEVQPDVVLEGNNTGFHVAGVGVGVIQENLPEQHRHDDAWMLERALKESEREMERQQMLEAQQILEACQQSKKQLQDQFLQQFEEFNSPVQPQLQRRLTKTRLEIETLHMIFHEDFVHLWNAGRVRVTHVDTYQGKKPGSINGCTVIAPLLCIHHFINISEAGRDDPGLPDQTVKTVIDDEVPSILKEVRADLGVAKDAFLIPSDSHDYLLKSQLLSSDQFLTVVGGNILDEGHLTGLVRTLVDGCPPPEIVKPENEELKEDENNCETLLSGEKNGTEQKNENGNKRESENSQPKPLRKLRPGAKLAATLFFHEHVVSILKLNRAHGKAWYDILDSLPSRSMLSREIGATFAKEEATSKSGQKDLFGFPVEDLESPLKCARIRCLDEEALTVALKWYACSKFSAENLNYIDTYAWDDKTTDFDPRVFQAFVWAEAE